MIISLLTGILIGSALNAQSLQETVEAIVNDPALSESTIGICVRTGEGKMLAEINSDNMIMPASNMKLISTGAALHHFGPDHQFITSIGHDGTISSGVLQGNLYIIGGGAKNQFLNRLTQEATKKTVIALPIEATALGNLKIQMEGK